MIQFELDNMIDFHRHWLRDKRFGARADFTDRTLKNLNITYKDLTGAIFKDSKIHSCDFSNANLTDVIASQAYFHDVNFTNATFKNAYLRKAKFTLSTFSNTDLWNVSGDGVYIISLQLGRKNVCYTSEILQVNCKQLDIKKIWRMSDDEVINKTWEYSEDELKEMAQWWVKWRCHIYQIVNLNPAEPVNSPK